MKQTHLVTLQEELRDSGLKVTPVRIRVLDLLKKDHCLLTIDEIVKRLSRTRPTPRVEWSTIYRSLLAFSKAGLVSETPLHDGSLRFEYQGATSGHHHHHVSCKGCGRIEPIHVCEIKKIEESVKKLGFTEISHRLEFTGYCKGCQK